jgi:hypothetical protein
VVSISSIGDQIILRARQEHFFTNFLESSTTPSASSSETLQTLKRAWEKFFTSKVSPLLRPPQDIAVDLWDDSFELWWREQSNVISGGGKKELETQEPKIGMWIKGLVRH